MSKYTTEVRFICETYAAQKISVGQAKINEIIAASRGKVFDFSYPIFDVNYRKVLETKIIKHYYFREIGFETVGLWKSYLDREMNEIMPYYNQLYKSELLDFNPFYDTDLSTDSKTEGKNEQETNSTNSEKEKYSDTPQGGLSGIESGTYLTSADFTDTEGSSNFSGNSTEDYLQHVKGKSGGASYSKYLKEYRETFLNIDRLVIDELEDLFMALW